MPSKLQYTTPKLKYDSERQDPINPYTEERASAAAGEAAMYAKDDSVYQPIKRGLQSFGRSEVLDAIKADAQRGSMTEAIHTAAQTGDPVVAREVLQDASIEPLEISALKKQAADYVPLTQADVGLIDQSEDFLSTLSAGSTVLDQHVAGVFSTVLGKEGVTLWEGGTSGLNFFLAPFGESTFSKDFVRNFKERMGLNNQNTDWLVGSGTQEVKQAFYDAPTTEDKIRVLDAIVYSMQNSESWIGADEVQKMFTLQNILGDYLQGRGSPELEEVLTYADNVFPLFDAMTPIKLIGTGIGVATGARRFSKIDKLQQVNPMQSRGLAVEGMSSPEVARALETTSEDILASSGIPKWKTKDGAVVTTVNAPQKVIDQLEVMQGTAGAVTDRLMRQGFMTPNRIKEEQVGWARDYLSTKTPFVHDAGGSSVAMLDDGMELSARYTKTKDGALWATEEEAVQAAKEVFTHPDTVIKPVAQDLGISGEGASGKSWGFEVQWKTSYEDSVYGKFADDDFPGGRNTLTDYVLDFGSKLSPELSFANARAFDISKYAASELSSLLKPFDKLSNKSRSRVASWLDEGRGHRPLQEEGFVYAPEELIAKGATDKELTAYYSSRVLQDAQYVINNQRLRSDLIHRGYSKAVAVSDDNPHFQQAIPFQPVDTEFLPRNIKEAYNPLTGTLAPVRENTTLGRMLTDLDLGTKRTAYVILDAARQIDLPKNVLKYDQGYVTTRYVDAYIVEKTGIAKKVDGVDSNYNKAIEMHPNKASAERARQQLQQERQARLRVLQDIQDPSDVVKAELRQLKSEDYRALHESKYNTQDLAQKEFDIAQVQGKMFFSRKGEQLEGMGGLAEIEDPISSMQRAARATAQGAVYDSMIQKYQQRFMNTYADLLDHNLKVNRSFPTSIQQISHRNSTQGLSAQKAEASARAAFRMIEKIRNPEGYLSKQWTAAMVSIADWIGEGVLAKAALGVAKYGPLKAIRAFNFLTMLTMNPFRQIFVQTQQFLFLSTLNPTYMAKLPIDYMALNAGFLAKPSKKAAGAFPYTIDEVAKLMAPVMQVSEAEYKATIKAFRESGLPNSIDSHMISHDAAVQMQTTIAKGLAQHAAQLGKKTAGLIVNVPRQIGFDFGEYNNLAATWLIARKEFLKQNPTESLSRSKNIDEIAARARMYALDMTAQGGFPYQKGALSAMTQFLSIQQKAWLSVLPKAVGGNKVFTAAQKRRIFAGQALLYGTTGWGITALYEKVKKEFHIETSEDTDRIWTAGAYEWAINTALSALTDKEQNLSLSKGIAPGGGTIDSISAMLSDAMSGSRSAWDLYIGAGASSRDRISNTVRHLGWTLRNPGIDNDEKILRAVEVLGGLSSGVSNYTRMRMAMNLESSVSANGSPIAKNTYLERQAKGWLGISSNDEEEFYRTLTRKNGRSRAIKTDAKVFLDVLLKDITRFDLEEGADPADRTIAAYQYRDNYFGYLMEMLGPEDGAAMWFEINELLKQQRAINGVDSVTASLQKSILEGRFGTDPWLELEDMRQRGDITAEQRDNMLKGFEDTTQSLHNLYTKEEK